MYIMLWSCCMYMCMCDYQSAMKVHVNYPVRMRKGPRDNVIGFVCLSSSVSTKIARSGHLGI